MRRMSLLFRKFTFISSFDTSRRQITSMIDTPPASDSSSWRVDGENDEEIGSYAALFAFSSDSDASNKNLSFSRTARMRVCYVFPGERKWCEGCPVEMDVKENRVPELKLTTEQSIS